MAGIEIHCMQGRLVPPEDGRIQAFPQTAWELELALAPAAGIDGIEWIYESYGELENPLSSPEGRAQLLELSSRHAVAIRSVCADWFMDHPLARDDSAAERLHWLAGVATETGIERVVVPCVDQSRLRDDGDADALVRAITESIGFLTEAGVEVHIESDLAPEPFARLLDRLDHPLVRANYDTGNSASLGYDPREEWEAYGARIGSVHVKDRVRGGGTVPLGEGDADLDTVFDLMIARGWDRPVVLQVARGPEGEEVAWVRAAAERVRALWEARSRAWI